jgi:UDP:flavonoid glycosyltransferase YjiC (YdhE family)
MRILFVTGGSPATVFALAPLATALRNLGHSVLMAANEDLMASVAATGIPAVPTVAVGIQHYVWTGHDGTRTPVPREPVAAMHHMGASFARMAVDSLAPLHELCRQWRPAVVVGGAFTYAAPLLAADLGVPWVRHTWDTVPLSGMDAGATDVLAGELTHRDLAALPAAQLLLDICPPALRPDARPGAHPMRWIPGNRQRRLEPWMYARDPRRHRILITSGTRAFMPDTAAFLRRLTAALTAQDAEVLLAAPEDVADHLRDELGDDVRTDWIPLDVVAPTCDLIVHHGGGVTAMTALNAGVPQLVTPKGAYLVAATRPMADAGVAVLLDEGQDTAEDTVKACAEILSDDTYRHRARHLSAAIAKLTAPPDAAHAVVALTREEDNA